jgi:starch synthase (maltosyl-transferring)
LAARTARNAPQIVIEDVRPEIDGGRHPVKRIIGDEVVVSADIYKDGHDLLDARICYGPAGERARRTAPLRYDYDSDRWSGSFVVDRIGRWTYTVEAWTDLFGSWRSGLEKKLGASLDVSSELAEGAALLDAAARRARGATRQQLRETSSRLADVGVPQAERASAALEPGLVVAMASLHVSRASTY